MSAMERLDDSSVLRRPRRADFTLVDRRNGDDARGSEPRDARGGDAPGECNPVDGRDRGELRAPGGASVASASPSSRIARGIAPDAVADEIVAALLAPGASIAPKYLYDPLGCALYDAIVLTPEYYPTRTEAAIFERYRDAIAAEVGRGVQLVDLGSGDSRKAEGWFAALRPARYVAVDIAAQAVTTALERLASSHPECELAGVVTDFSAALDLAGVLREMPTLFFYPGSSIGNFDPDAALRFLREVRDQCPTSGSGLLIGVDTRKPASRLVAAYDDTLGVTAAFNRNLLRHVNRLIGSDFDPGDWRHVARFDERSSRVEMHLEAVRDVAVDLRGSLRRFRAGERIHTESSYKYAPAEFASMLREAGFADPASWQDPARDFAVFHARLRSPQGARSRGLS